ncbi:MAG TPA: methylenetetrahydrofolate reductase [Candidatus Limnocylindria bacterium]|nr:methylenetetrahydrofolate reductase [Candidatus Limnocylindria bacterium]
MRLAALSAAQRQALVHALGRPKLEVLPLGGMDQELAALAPGATLAVTASPAKGLETSVAVGERLQLAGFAVVVHLAARMVRDRGHLHQLLDRLRDGGIERAFVIGGDAREPGAYPDALSLLRDMADAGHHLREIGIGAYPQGHPVIPDAVLQAALAAKVPYADYMTTQLCFDADALAGWVAAQRRAGNVLPVDIGIPGAVEATRLLRISARIGVADAARFVSKQGSLVARLLRPGGYRPEGLLRDLAPTLADPGAAVRGLHVFTFNQVRATDAWRRRFLASLGDG